MAPAWNEQIIKEFFFAVMRFHDYFHPFLFVGLVGARATHVESWSSDVVVDCTLYVELFCDAVHFL